MFCLLSQNNHTFLENNICMSAFQSVAEWWLTIFYIPFIYKIQCNWGNSTLTIWKNNRSLNKWTEKKLPWVISPSPLPYFVYSKLPCGMTQPGMGFFVSYYIFIKLYEFNRLLKVSCYWIKTYKCWVKEKESWERWLLRKRVKVIERSLKWKILFFSFIWYQICIYWASTCRDRYN